MSSAAPPVRIGPYEVVARLGAGGMAETFVAVRRGPGGFAQRVCLKRLRPELERDPELIRQFMAEAATAARLRHAAITQVLDFGQDGDDYYLALELVEGCDLRALLHAAGGALPPPLALHVAIELATALDFAQRATFADAQHGVVHRDISPSNTLISAEGEVKLTDFGIARWIGADQHTRTGVVKGKVPYMAPEYARSGELDARSDLFSLGVLLYECLCGARPHDGATDLETLERASRGEHRPLAARAPAVPPALAQIVERLLEPDPERRYPTAASLLEALLSLPAPARARLELAALLAQLGCVRRDPPQAAADLARLPTEPLAAPGAPAESAPRSTRALEAPAVPASARRGPRLALAVALLFALGVLGFAVLRGADAPAPRASSSPPPKAASATGAAPAARPSESAVVVRPEPSLEQPPTDDSAGSARPSPNGWLEVVVLPYGEVLVDGRLRGSAPVKLELAPGSHEIEARSRGNVLRRRITLAERERRQVVLR